MKRPLCRNCGHTIEGNYCSHCGQRTNVERLTWASLGESFTSTFIGDEAFGIKGVNMRRGMFMTWVLILLHPVTSIKEYLAGCRHKYFNPVAILLMLSTLYALLYSWVDNSYTPTADFETQHWAIFLIRSFIDYAKIHPAAYTLASLPMFALALRTVFRHKLRLRYIEYLYVGIFISIFEISLMTAMLPVEAYRPDISHWKLVTLPAFIYTAIAYYRLFALRTVKGAVYAPSSPRCCIHSTSFLS